MDSDGLEVDMGQSELSQSLTQLSAKEEHVKEELESASVYTTARMDCSTFSSESIMSCRICKNASGPDLVPSPCHCKGSMGTVHVSCLEEWLTGSIRDSCELCASPFKVIRTRKFGCLQSIWLFMRYHINIIKLVRDMFFFSISLMNTSILMYMWASSLITFIIGGRQQEINIILMNNPLKGTVYFFFFTLCFLFVSVNAIDDFRRIFYFYFLPWYHWWQTSVTVKLIVDSNEENKSKDQ